jgi:TRAP-type C4-dicarboxylate transport system permease small subunit
MDADQERATPDDVGQAFYLPAVTRAASFLLACAVVLMTAQVILRFGFNAPQAWAEEVDRYLFIWSVYLGAAVALIKGTHIRVTFVVDQIPGGEALSQWLTRIIGVLAFGFTAYHGFYLFWVNRNSEFYTIQGMPQGIFYLAAPVGLTIMCLHLLLLIVAELKGAGEK